MKDAPLMLVYRVKGRKGVALSPGIDRLLSQYTAGRDAHEWANTHLVRFRYDPTLVPCIHTSYSERVLDCYKRHALWSTVA